MNKITPPHELADEVLDAASASASSAVCLTNCNARGPAERAEEALDATTAAFVCVTCRGFVRHSERADEALDAMTAALTLVASRCQAPADLSDEVLDAGPAGSVVCRGIPLPVCAGGGGCASGGI